MDDDWRTIENPAIKDIVRFVRTAEETDGELTELDIQLGPRGGNALHAHASYTEGFEVLEGTLGVQVGRTKTHLREGESALVPIGAAHRFFNPTDEPTRFRVQVREGHTGFEQALRILYGLARDGKTNGKGVPKSLMDVAVLGPLSDMRLAGPMAVLNPILRLAASRGIARGRDRELIARYCTPPA